MDVEAPGGRGEAGWPGGSRAALPVSPGGLSWGRCPRSPAGSRRASCFSTDVTVEPTRVPDSGCTLGSGSPYGDVSGDVSVAGEPLLSFYVLFCGRETGAHTQVASTQCASPQSGRGSGASAGLAGGSGSGSVMRGQMLATPCPLKLGWDWSPASKLASSCSLRREASAPSPQASLQAAGCLSGERPPTPKRVLHRVE